MGNAIFQSIMACLPTISSDQQVATVDFPAVFKQVPSYSLVEIKDALTFFLQILLSILVVLLILGIAVQLQFVPLVPIVQKYLGMLHALRFEMG